MKTISKILSYVFHPLLIPTWMILLLLYSNPFSFTAIKMSLGLAVIDTFLQTFFIPFILIAVSVKLELVGSFEMNDNKQRIVPLIITIICYIWFYKVTEATSFPKWFTAFMLGAAISICLSFVINVFRKISLHMVGISGALIAVLILLQDSQTDLRYVFLVMVILTGAVATARLYMGAHTIREVYSGFIIGIFGQLVGALFVS